MLPLPRVVAPCQARCGKYCGNGRACQTALFVGPSFYVILHTAGDAVKRFFLGDKVRRAAVGEVAGD